MMRLHQRASRGARQWRRDLSGVAAVEFAIILPVLAALLLGGFAVTTMVLTYRKLCDTTAELADMVSTLGASGDPNILLSNLQTTMSAASTVMYPASTSNLTVTVGLIDFNSQNAPIAGNTPTTTWIYKLSGSTLTAVTTPAPTANVADTLNETNIAAIESCTGTTTPCYSYFWVRTDYNFQPSMGGSYTAFSIPMSSQIYIQPRDVNVIYCTTDGSTPC